MDESSYGIQRYNGCVPPTDLGWPPRSKNSRALAGTRFQTHLYRIWCRSRQNNPRQARHSHRWVRCVRSHASYRLVGTREWDGIQHRRLFLSSHGLRVQGLLWAMLWMLVWGTFMLDGWVRHRMFANDFFPNRLRPGKILIDSIIALSNE
jgi:hypothetical protein